MGRAVPERQSHSKVQKPRLQPGVQEFQNMFRTLQTGRLRSVDVEKKVSSLNSAHSRISITYALY